MATTASHLGAFLMKCFPGGTSSTMRAALKTLDVATMGTQEASKFITTDANTNQGIVKCTALHIGTSGSETQVTSTAAELNKLDTVTATATELNYLDIATLGTGADSKAVVLDSGEDYTWPSAGVLTYGGTGISATGAEINYLDITTLGTGAASKAVVLDTGEDYTWPTAGILTYGGGAINATGAEITRVADASVRVVALDATTLAITAALHGERIVRLDHTAATSTVTLPAASGTGNIYTFIVGAVNANGHVIEVANSSDTIDGSVNILDNDSNAQTAYSATGADDTITLNGTTTGGQIGDWVQLVDIAANQWAVVGQLVCPAGSNVADMFSAAV